MPSTTIIQATSSFSFDSPDGVPVSIREGETFHKDSPRLQGLSDEALAGSFKSFVPDHDLEQATAAPGEKRRGPRRKKNGDSKEQATAAPGESEDGNESESASADAGAKE